MVLARSVRAGFVLTRLTLCLRRFARRVLHVLRHAGQALLVLDKKRKRIGRIEHVFRKFGTQFRQFFGNRLEAKLLVFCQIGTGQSEVAQLVVDDPAPRNGQKSESRCGFQRFVLAEQREVLAQVSPVFADLRQVVVVGVAQFRAVDDGVQMAHRAPGARQLFIRVFERRDEIVPGVAAVGSDLCDGRAARRDELIHRRCDVSGVDFGEARQARKIQQRVGGQVLRSVGRCTHED